MASRLAPAVFVWRLLSPPDQLQVVTYDPFGVAPHPGRWPPGLYGTDASGGRWDAYANLRRCGCGVSRLRGLDPPFQIEFGAHFPLTGSVQTVPRAELFAIWLVVSRVPAGKLMIVSDSEVNVNIFHKSKNSRSHALGSTNGDLWKQIFDSLDSKALDFSLFWVPGHLDSDVSKVRTSVPGYLFALNHIADAFAGRASLRIDHDLSIASPVIWYSR